ncbi:hypothetical protein EVJ58_g11165 [Rhodofomes roseus]|uniref:Uncharacterized protein n=1 Tax=Rhodofomes roseus TaxID=34475 RepID=A0A4Y9XLT8_9APHY|nr:hypothetical protein EVJ58_g11165 [Rhodofomes roseus]
MPALSLMAFLTRLLPTPSDNRLAYNNVQGELLTEANEGIPGGSIVGLVDVPGTTRLQVGLPIAVVITGNNGPSFYGVIEATVAVNKDWTLFHVRGDLGEDCLLLAPHRATRSWGWTSIRRHLLPDHWLDVFPSERIHEQALVTPQVDPPPRSPSPPSLPEQPAPPPPSSPDLDDADSESESLRDRTAELRLTKREEEYHPWMRAGCPGQSMNIAEHIALVQEMADAREAALQHTEEGLA